MAKISRDLTTPAGGTALLHSRETLVITGNLAAINAEVVCPADGCSSFAVDLRGTFNLALEVSGTVDGTNWTPIPVRPANQVAIAYVATITGAVQGVWMGKTGPYRSIRVRCSAYTSGSCTTTLSVSTGILDDSLSGMVSTNIVTVTAVSGAIATLSLPAPGVGLRQYITYISINRFAAAVLVPAATPVLVTTTNLPGTLVFSFPAEAAAQGTMDRLREDFAYPVAASAQNTAVTVVGTATAGVIWRITAAYYIAP